MNFAEQKQEIEKGCGLVADTWTKSKCGDEHLGKETKLRKFKRQYCSKCKAKLTQLEADMKLVGETIAKLYLERNSDDINDFVRKLGEKLFGGNNEKP